VVRPGLSPPAPARALALAAALAVASAGAAESFTLDLSADGDGGRAVLFGIAQQRERWGWDLEFAHSRADAAVGSAFGADDLGLGFDWQGDTWSVGLELDRWQDSNDVESILYTARLGWSGAAWRVELVPRAGTVSTVLPDPTSRDLVGRDFDRSALGLALTHTGSEWTWWLEGAEWDYSPPIAASSTALATELADLVDLRILATLVRNGQVALVDQYLTAVGATELQQVLQDQGLAGLGRVIRFQARRVQYASSLHTFALGLSDATLRAGIERRIGAGALALEFEQLEIPVDALQASSLALRWRWPLGGSVDATASFGMVDTESYGSTSYLGFTLQWYVD
jgi:hypothetical protein